jgi:hypothetical protein
MPFVQENEQVLMLEQRGHFPSREKVPRHFLKENFGKWRKMRYQYELRLRK